MPHTKRYKKYQLGRGLADLLFMTYIQNFAQPPGETSHLLRFVSRQQPQLLVLPHHILSARGRTALHWAAEEGHAAVVEQLISAGATVDAAGWNGRGPGRVFGSFWEWLWRGDGRVVHWQGIFVLCFGMLSGIRSCCVRIHFCEWMGLLQFGYKRLDMGEMSGRHVVTNVHWIWNF